MNNQLNCNAVLAWAAFGAQDYSNLERYGNEIYNYFVHNPTEILKLDSPLLIGKIFQVCLGFQELDEDIQEVRAENAFLCFSQALKSDKTNIHDEACARLMILLIRDQKHLIGQIERACQNECANPYSFFEILNDGLPNDMPMAANTKMLFTSYYLYESIRDKVNVNDRFININERNTFEHVKAHVLDNCGKLLKTLPARKMELGSIVFNRVVNKLQKDIERYSGMK